MQSVPQVQFGLSHPVGWPQLQPEPQVQGSQVQFGLVHVVVLIPVILGACARLPGQSFGRLSVKNSSRYLLSSISPIVRRAFLRVTRMPTTATAQTAYCTHQASRKESKE